MLRTVIFQARQQFLSISHQNVNYYATLTKQPPKSGRTPAGEFDDPNERKMAEEENDEAPRRRIVNQETGEIGGPQGPEPTRYGDWERKDRVSDF